MISDEELKDIQTTGWYSAGTVKEMAAELLERRAAEKAVWENAPDWANWYAEDENGLWLYYEKKPTRGARAWFALEGKYNPALNAKWKNSLQERPK